MKDIPVIHVRSKTIAEGYEKAIYEVYKNGCEIKTQYDKEGAPASKDCTLNLVIDEPLSDPMIHKAFPGGIADLREYVYELHGYKDEWVKNINDPKDTRWEYTYHGRLTRYGAWKHIPDYSGSMAPTGCWTNGWQNGDLSSSDGTVYKCGIDQIDWVVNKLANQPYTRQAQMITWMPTLDMNCYDPPCLQSMWFRITADENDQMWINTNIRFRSNDGYGASFMNMFGLVQLIKTISSRVEKKMGKPINMGRLNWQADSYHIYGKDLQDVKLRLIDKIESDQPFEKRVMSFYDETIQEIYHECESSILEKIKSTVL
jgi:thymidylate synthase